MPAQMALAFGGLGRQKMPLARAHFHEFPTLSHTDSFLHRLIRFQLWHTFSLFYKTTIIIRSKSLRCKADAKRPRRRYGNSAAQGSDASNAADEAFSSNYFGIMIMVIILPSMYGAFSTSPKGAISCDSRSRTFLPVAT